MIEGIHEKLNEAEEAVEVGEVHSKDRLPELYDKANGMLGQVSALEQLGAFVAALGEWADGAVAKANVTRDCYKTGYMALHGVAAATNNSNLLNAMAAAHQATEQSGSVGKTLQELQNSLEEFCQTFDKIQQETLEIAMLLQRAAGLTESEPVSAQFALRAINDYKDHI